MSQLFSSMILEVKNTKKYYLVSDECIYWLHSLACHLASF